MVFKKMNRRIWNRTFFSSFASESNKLYLRRGPNGNTTPPWRFQGLQARFLLLLSSLEMESQAVVLMHEELEIVNSGHVAMRECHNIVN